MCVLLCFEKKTCKTPRKGRFASKKTNTREIELLKGLRIFCLYMYIRYFFFFVFIARTTLPGCNRQYNRTCKIYPDPNLYEIYFIKYVHATTDAVATYKVKQQKISNLRKEKKAQYTLPEQNVFVYRAIILSYIHNYMPCYKLNISDVCG